MSGQDWKPGMTIAPATVTMATSAPSGGAEELNNKIQSQGELVRDLKSKKAPKVSEMC